MGIRDDLTAKLADPGTYEIPKVYVAIVDGEPIAHSEDVDELRRWVDSESLLAEIREYTFHSVSPDFDVNEDVDATKMIFNCSVPDTMEIGLAA